MKETFTKHNYSKIPINDIDCHTLTSMLFYFKLLLYEIIEERFNEKNS